MYVIGWSGSVGEWRLYEIRYKKIYNTPLVGCKQLFMHLLFADELLFCWPEDTKAEFFIGSPGAYKSHW